MRTKLYPIFLHIALIALAVMTLHLSRQNRELVAQLPAPPPQLEVGSQVSEIAVQDLDGRSRTLSWDGSQRDRLLLVFTTTCPACLENQEAWKELYQAASPNTEVVAVSLDSLEATRAYRDTYDLPFEVVVAADGQTFADQYEVSVVPSTFRIGADGKVRGVWSGGLSDDQKRQAAAS